MQVADLISTMVGPDIPVRVIGYDGSKAGPDSSEVALRISSPRALARLATAPGTLGLARAYVEGEIEVEGDLHAFLDAIADLTFHDITRADQVRLAAKLAPVWARHRQPPPRWRRARAASCTPSCATGR
jgi:cyclopropane-fatty-acyl-phospholipid synthase